MTASASKSSSRKPKIRIGVPKEVKIHEGRVGLTPEGAVRLVRAGAEVRVQKGAGVISGYPDAEYRKAGAKITSLAETWNKSDLIVKIKELTPPEFKHLRKGLTLFSYLHLAPDPAFTRALLDKQVLAIDYEHVEMDNGVTPLLKPMSDVAGHLAITLGAYYLATYPQGAGLLLGGLSGVFSGEVVVVGAGTVGLASARQALGIEANVTVLDISAAALKRARKELGPRAKLIKSTPAALRKAVASADLLVGAVYSHGERAPKVISAAMVKSMKKGSLVVDVAIDQGGCIETSRPTNHEAPLFVKHGVLHYCVPNMPGTVPQTSTSAITSVTLPYVERMVKLGVEGALRRYPELARAVDTREGRIIHEGVRRSLPALARRHG